MERGLRTMLVFCTWWFMVGRLILDNFLALGILLHITNQLLSLKTKIIFDNIKYRSFIKYFLLVITVIGN